MIGLFFSLLCILYHVLNSVSIKYDSMLFIFDHFLDILPTLVVRYGIIRQSSLVILG